MRFFALALSLLGALAFSSPIDKAVDLKFTSAGITLVGTLYEPDGPGPYPVIVSVQGSGPVVRSSSFYQADRRMFVPHGFAVFLWDKRGCGASGGQFNDTEAFSVLASDVVAAVGAMKSRPEIDPKRIVVKGLSQGAWIAPLAATLCPDISGVICIGGGGVSVLDQMIYIRGQMLLDSGLTFDEVQHVNGLRRKVWQYYQTGKGYDEAKADWQAASKEPWFAKAGWKGDLATPEDVKDPQYDFFRNYTTYDPAPVLSRLHVPVIALFGTLDRFGPPAESVAGWQSAIEGGHLTDATVRIFANAGHAINVMPNGFEKVLVGPEHEQKMKEMKVEFIPGFEDYLVGWVKARFLR